MAKKNKVDYFCADFETNVTEETCKLNPVWAWGICQIDTDKVYTGTSIGSFFEFIATLENESIIYFHNLGFDGSFIIDYALRNGFKAVLRLTKESSNREFSVLRNKGKLYQIEFLFSHKTIKFWDSYKKLPMAISALPKAFNFEMEICKGEIDYNIYRAPNHILSSEELDYLERDILIDCKALSAANDLGIKNEKMTIGGNAYADWSERFIKRWGADMFEQCFLHYTPEEWQLSYDAYRGGVCTVNPKYKGKMLSKGGRVYDVNSMYPAVMQNCSLPFGKGVMFSGTPENNGKLWVANFCAKFYLRKGAIAVFKPKHYPHLWGMGDMMENSGIEISVTLTSVDFATFSEHYIIDITKWNGGYYYDSCTGMFDDYIEYWGNLKMQAVEQGNKALKTVAKLMLNNLYGKFGQCVELTSELPEIDDDIVKWHNEMRHVEQLEYTDPFTNETENLGLYTNNRYIPIAAFVTSYARAILCDAIRKAGKRFLYCDTDSVHVLDAEKDIDGLDVDPVKLGAWDLEGIFFGARYWRPKAYQEYICYHGTTPCEGYWDLKLAGCPKAALENIDPVKDFVIGNVFTPKLVPKHVHGGVILEDVGYEFKEKQYLL